MKKNRTLIITIIVLIVAAIAIVAGLYMLKYATLKFVSFLFSFRDEIDDYNFNFFIVYKLLGLCLIPVNLLIAYSPPGIDHLMVLASFDCMAKWCKAGPFPAVNTMS